MILCGEEHAKAIDKSVFPGLQGGPLMHVIAGKAVAFGEALRPEFRQYGQRTIDNARAMATKMANLEFPVVSGGTDTHLLLVDVGVAGISGRKAEQVLDRAGISCNRNTVPGDTRSPMQTSGIRLGTPAITTRGFGIAEVERVGSLIAETLRAADDEATIDRVRGQVRELTHAFPVPGFDLTEG